MTEEERAHMERMVQHARKVAREKKEQRKERLTPQELADAIKDLKKRYPNEFTK